MPASDVAAGPAGHRSAGWRAPRWAAPTTLPPALVGLAASAYLTWSHYTSPRVLACPDTGLVNCAKVTTSPQSMLFGIVPVALVGLGYFAAMTALSVPAAWRAQSQTLRQVRLVLAAAGALSVVYLVYVELFRVDAICLYCTAVHVAAVLLFASTALATSAGPPAPPLPGGSAEASR